MDQIDKKFLDKLRDAGLHVSPPIPAYGGGVWVLKPTDTKGHHVPEFESGYVSFEEDPAKQPDTNAPMIAFYKNQSSWVVDCNGTGEAEIPIDFLNEWKTPEEAVDDILDFYFGDSSRMISYAFAHGKLLAKAEALRKRKEESKSNNS